MYSEQLEKLIEIALVDGELTEKEKQILFKKAESLGVDLDEFEMVLQAKLFERQKSNKSVTVAPKSDRLGDVKKCPACGSIAQSFATKCAECGTEFRNVEASQNIIKFFEKLDEVESARKDSLYDNQDSKISVGTLLKWLFFYWILIPLRLITFIANKSKPAKWSTTDSRKEELILNFPVPASREEILEFLTLASSKINANTYFNVFAEETKYKDAWNKIWLKKIEQIHSKATMAMKNDEKSLDDVNKISESARLVVKNNNNKVIHIALGFIAMVVIFIIWGIIASKIDDNNLAEQKELKSKAELLIKSGKFVEAEKIISIIDNETFVIELKSKMQLEELTKKINDLEVFLEKKEYSKLKLEIEKITWTKISTDYKTEDVEKDIYKTFLKKKEAINNQLPEKYRITIESEYSL